MNNNNQFKWFPEEFSKQEEQAMEKKLTAEVSVLKWEYDKAVSKATRSTKVGGAVILGSLALIGAGGGVVLVILFVLLSAFNLWEPLLVVAIIIAIFFFKRMSADKDVTEKLRIEYEQKVKRVTAERQTTFSKKIADYRVGFSKAVDQIVLKLAGSEQTERAAAFLLENFTRLIEDSSRPSNLEKVDLVFRIDFFADRIVFNNGMIDFDVNRLEKMTSPVEISALAHVVAKQLKMQATLKHGEDPSGTASVIEYEEGVRKDFKGVVITFRYLAPNGYYEPVKTW